jgi:hypothetical protein
MPVFMWEVAIITVPIVILLLVVAWSILRRPLKSARLSIFKIKVDFEWEPSDPETAEKGRRL